jgi:hypothetical protein
MTDDELSETDVPKDFSVISWFRSIPLCDDVWLGMQAQHIAAVEIGIIRPLELHTARRLFNEEGCPALTSFRTLTPAGALMARPWSARCYGVARQREGSRQTSIGGSGVLSLRHS